MAKIEKIIVNGKTYQVQTLGVLDTLSLHLTVTKYLGPAIGKISDVVISMKNGKDVDMSELGKVLADIKPDDVKELQMKVFAQVITPENTFLSDALSVETWFSKPGNEGDVWEVFYKATFELLGEYLPNFIKGMFQKTEMENSALQSLKSSK